MRPSPASPQRRHAVYSVSVLALLLTVATTAVLRDTRDAAWADASAVQAVAGSRTATAPPGNGRGKSTTTSTTTTSTTSTTSTTATTSSTTTSSIPVVTVPTDTIIPVVTLPPSWTTTTAEPAPTPTISAPETTAPLTLVPTTSVPLSMEPVYAARLDSSAQRALGYAEWRGITGGLGRSSYVVTSAGDRGPGTYRDALSVGDRYITFSPALDGQVIVLDDDVTTSASNITIDAAGRDITVSRFATKFSGTNIVVAGMQFRNMTGSSDEDAVTFRGPSTEQVFALYGNTFETATDGLVDVIWNGGHDVYGTICGNRFLRHDKAMLIHSGDTEHEGGRYYVTLCENSWVDVYQRAPFTRDARIHQYNDVFDRYGKPDGAGGGSKSGADSERSQHWLQNNIAVPRRSGEVTWTGDAVTQPRTEFAGPQMGDGGAIRIDGSLLLANGGTTATQVESARDEVGAPPYQAAVMPADALTKAAVERHAGTCARNPVPAVNPCAPIVTARGGVVAFEIDGDPASVVVRVDGADVGPARHVGGRRWEATLPAGTVGWVDAVITDHSGTVTHTNRAIVTAR